MSRKLMIRTVAGSFAISAVIGFVMQSTAGADRAEMDVASAPRVISIAPVPNRAPVVDGTGATAFAGIDPDQIVELSSFGAADEVNAGQPNAPMRLARIMPPELPARSMRPTSLPVPQMVGMDLPEDLQEQAATTFNMMSMNVAEPTPDTGSMLFAALDFFGLRAPANAAEAAPTADHCTPTLELAAAAGAMIVLDLHAPCDPGARLVLRHADLAVTVRPDASGRLTTTFPALVREAVVSVGFPDGSSYRAEISVPGLESYHRVALQWQGDDAFLLHAYEFGAEFGMPGHVWIEAPGTVTAGDGTDSDSAGFLVRLGDDLVHWPLMADIYSFPAGARAEEGRVRLEVEAIVSSATCGREMLAETLQADRGNPVTIGEVTLAMPDCDTPDGFLVLKNLFPTMTIAQN